MTEWLPNIEGADYQVYFGDKESLSSQRERVLEKIGKGIL